MSIILALVGLALIVAGVLWRIKLPKEAMPPKVQPGGSGSKSDAASRLAQVVGAPRREAKPAVRQATDGARKAKLARQDEASLNPTLQPSGKERVHPVDPALASGPSLIGQKQRRSERILLRVPVEVAGTDADGNVFTERTYTLVVNRHGCSLNLRKSLRANDRITITNLLSRESCAFRVCQLAQSRPGEVMEWGADCLEPERNFWGIYFPEDVQKVSPPGSIPVELECAVCRSREIQELSPDQFNTLAKLGALTRDCSKCGTATEWQFAFVEAEGEAPVPPPPEPGPMAVSPPKGIENRRQKRLALRLHVRISYEDGRAENTMTEDVSKSGICCASNLAMKVADAVTLTFEPGQETGEEETPARIAWRRPVGETGRALYGIMLEEINHKLNGVIEDFSSP